MKIFVVLLLAIAGISSASDICDTPPFEACPTNNAPEPPGTAEEFNEFCTFALPFFDCNIDYFTKCPHEAPLTAYTRSKPGLENICDRDSRLYSAITENIQCLKEAAMQFKGCQLRKESEYSHERHVEALTKNDLEHRVVPENSDCLYSLFEISCFAITAGRKCGKDAQGLVIDLIQEFPLVYEPCDADVLEKLPEITETLETEHTEYNMLDLMQRRK